MIDTAFVEIYKKNCVYIDKVNNLFFTGLQEDQSRGFREPPLYVISLYFNPH